jgi:hypothetical protein
MTTAIFTADEINAQAQGNVAVFPLVTLAYLRERGLDPDDWVTFVGAAFAPTWDELRDADALTVARMAALNLASAGARIVDLTGGADRAEAVLIGWPDEEALAFFGLTPAEADRFLGVFGPVAAHLDLRFAARRDGDRLALTFAR